MENNCKNCKHCKPIGIEYKLPRSILTNQDYRCDNDNSLNRNEVITHTIGYNFNIDSRESKTCLQWTNKQHIN